MNADNDRPHRTAAANAPKHLRPLEIRLAPPLPYARGSDTSFVTFDTSGVPFEIGLALTVAALNLPQTRTVASEPRPSGSGPTGVKERR